MERKDESVVELGAATTETMGGSGPPLELLLGMGPFTLTSD